MRAYKTDKGAWQLSYTEEGKQKTLYLGVKFTALDAEQVARISTELFERRSRREPISVALEKQVLELPQRIINSLEKLGLFTGRSCITLSKLCDEFLVQKQLEDIKQSTYDYYTSTLRMIRKYFGEELNVLDLDSQAAKDYRHNGLKTLSHSTIYRRIGTCKSLFDFAVAKGYIVVNPFAGIKVGRAVNGRRLHFVSRSVIAKVMDHCKDDRDRLAVALGRFAGVRVPSEIRDLTFADFSDEKIRIHEDTKTGARTIPLYREIKEIFVRLKGRPDERVFGDRFMKQRNSWWMLKRAIESAGLPVWEKLWINLRSSCISEIVKLNYGEKTLDSIFGNSAKIRKEHYEQFLIEEEYRRVLSDNTAIVDYLRNNGGTINETETPFSLHDILERVKTLVKSFEPTKQDIRPCG